MGNMEFGFGAQVMILCNLSSSPQQSQHAALKQSSLGFFPFCLFVCCCATLISCYHTQLISMRFAQVFFSESLSHSQSCSSTSREDSGRSLSLVATRVKVGKFGKGGNVRGCRSPWFNFLPFFCSCELTTKNCKTVMKIC